MDASRAVSGLTLSEPQADLLVREAYTALLGRPPDDDGLRFYTGHLRHGRMTIAAFLTQLTASAEFAEKSVGLGYALERDETIQEWLRKPDVSDLSGRLAACTAFTNEHMDALVAPARLRLDAVPEQRTYADEHRRRFFELFHAASALTRHLPHPRVLEFGPSAYSSLYTELLPGCWLVLADRPTTPGRPGFTAALCEHIAGPTPFVEVDLLGDLDAAAARLDRHGPFDLIVFTEVLEHIARHPGDVLAFLLGRLSAEGFLYLTTPNALSRGKLHTVGRRRNPQQLFPRQADNWDAHHHVREYTMGELIDLVCVAHGLIRALHFSACWDEPAYGDYLDQHADQRGNLVVVASRSS